MRKFTKCLLTLALLVLTVGGAKAEKVYADLSQYGDKWDGTDLTFSWNAQWGNQLGPNLDAVGLPKGDLRNWQKLVVVVDELNNCDFFRVLVYSGDDTNHSNTFKCNKTGANEFTLSGNVDFLNNVTRICLSGSNGEDSKKDSWGETPASFKVKEVYLEKPDIVYIEASEIFEAPAGTTDIKNLTGTNTGWAGTVTYPKELAVQGQAFGDGDGSNEKTHVNIDGYDYICFNVTTATDNTAGLRVWIWDGEAGGAGSVKTLYAYPIADYATADYTVATKISAGVGTYVAKVTGYKYLKGVKAANDWGSSAAKVSMAYMCTGAPVAYVPTNKYALVGEVTGSATLSDALADANATCYDATGVTGTGVDLTGVANPNALFIAGDGVLANTKNVIVSDVCANLELVDGKPFKAPAAFTATNAKFTKTISKAGYGTMVIPFAAALPTGVKAYNLTGVSGTAITTTDAATIAANKPVLLEAAEGNCEFTATSAAIAGSEDASTNGLLNGTYAGAKAAADANNYVLQNGDAGLGFFLVTGTEATVNPFRAYLNTDVSAPEFLAIEGLGITGIEAVKATESKGEFFNLAGQRVAQPAKGLYIVNGKKVIVK